MEIDDNLLAPLVARLRATASTRAIGRLLRSVKEERALRPGDLHVSGNKEQLLHTLCSGVDRGFISLGRIASLVAELEENGSQHIFLFNLTQQGLNELSPQRLGTAFRTPSSPSPAMYQEAGPDQPQIYFKQRRDVLVVKQIHTATYWERDTVRSFETDSERAVFDVQRRCRALNILRIIPRYEQAEIRIDRLSGSDRDKDVGRFLQDFLHDLSPTISADRHLRPTPIWDGFQAMVNARTDTHMNVDVAADPSVRVHISGRREGSGGRDVRDHPSYKYSSSDYVRDRLSISWFVHDKDELEDYRVHTIMSRFGHRDRIYAKVYISATMPPKVLDHVLGKNRFRFFAKWVRWCSSISA